VARTKHSSPSQPTGTAACRYQFVRGFRFLVASPPVQDLLFSAKHLFGAASYCATSAASYLGPARSGCSSADQCKPARPSCLA